MTPVAMGSASPARLERAETGEASEPKGERSFEEILEEQPEPSDSDPNAVVDCAPVELPLVAIFTAPEPEPEAPRSGPLELATSAKIAPREIEEEAPESAAPEVEVAEAFEVEPPPPLQEPSTPVDLQPNLRSVPEIEAPAPKHALVQPDAIEPAFEDLIRVDRIEHEGAELVIGEGKDRLALRVETEGQRVHVSARAPSVEMVDALARSSNDLRDALEGQGFELGNFDARRERSGDAEEQQKERHAERHRAVVKKKRIVA